MEVVFHKKWHFSLTSWTDFPITKWLKWLQRSNLWDFTVIWHSQISIFSGNESWHLPRSIYHHFLSGKFLGLSVHVKALCTSKKSQSFDTQIRIFQHINLDITFYQHFLSKKKFGPIYACESTVHPAVMSISDKISFVHSSRCPLSQVFIIPWSRGCESSRRDLWPLWWRVVNSFWLSF